MEIKKTGKQFLLMIMAGFIGGSISGVLFASKVIEADDFRPLLSKYFQLVDKESNVKGDFTTNADGYGSLELEDPAGAIRVRLGGKVVDRKMMTISFAQILDKNGSPIIDFMMSGEHENPRIVLKDRFSRPRMVLGIGQDGGNDEPFISYIDMYNAEHQLFDAQSPY